ncbi:MAG: ThiF family adenylyltransferase [Sedimentisphaerales bacterium]|nr:ThiF family adenylyltransferase [Sedimentisphaerales bacterium]
MLSKKQKVHLDKVFASGGLTELSLQQSRKIALKTKIPLRYIEWFALEKGIVPCRYQRNIGSIGITGQKKLLESKIIIIGLGGLGGYVAEELARLGAGRIIGVDPGAFDQTNLNRQLFSDESNINKKKIDLAGKRLKKINQGVDFKGFAISFDKLPDRIWHNTDVVFDCLDNIADRFVLADKCSQTKIPLVHGAIAGWYGQVAVIWPKTAMLEKIYRNRTFGIEKNMGNPPFTAAVAASLMAAESIKILIGKILEKKQKLLFFDLLEGEWQTIRF